MCEEDSEESDICAAWSDEASSGTLLDSFLGKLKSFCPTLFIKLSSWEWDFLDKYFPSFLVPSIEDECKKKDTFVHEVPSHGSDRTPSLPTPVVISTSTPEVSLLQTSLDMDVSTLPTTSQPVLYLNLNLVIDTLIPTLRETIIPTPLQNFWGMESQHGNSVYDNGRNQTSMGEG